MPEQEPSAAQPTEGRSRFVFTGNTLVDGATLLALITGFGYLLIYFYELGWCNHFGVPTELIAVNPVKLVWVPAGIAIAYWVTSFVLEMVDPAGKLTVNPNLWPPLRVWLLQMIWWIVGAWAQQRWYYIMWGVIITSGPFIMPLFNRDRSLTYADKVANLWTKELKVVRLSDKMHRRVGVPLMFTLMLVFMSVYISWSIGQGLATRETDFAMITADDPSTGLVFQYIVVAHYGDTFIAARIVDPNTLKRGFRLFTEGEISRSGLHMYDVTFEHIVVDFTPIL